jgi:hypothetical protein
VVIRPYTPVTTPDTRGYMDLIVKVYPQGKMSKHFGDMKVRARKPAAALPPSAPLCAPSTRAVHRQCTSSTGSAHVWYYSRRKVPTPPRAGHHLEAMLLGKCSYPSLPGREGSRRAPNPDGFSARGMHWAACVPMYPSPRG